MLFICFLYFFISAKGDIYNMYFNRITSTFLESLKQESFSCNSLSDTRRSPFVVILLYQSSGHFLGMGGIVDKTTIITSASVLEMAGEKIEEVLVLAGYFSPWWGEHAQVRRAHSKHVSDFEVVLLVIKPKLKFNDEIRPLRIFKLPPNSDTEYTFYGVQAGEGFMDGDVVQKTAVYYPSKHEAAPFDNCAKNYQHLGSDLDKSTHECFLLNGSFCRGCLGSPVARVRRSKSNPNLLGVIIRSTCAKQQALMVKLSAFEDWLNYKINIEGKSKV